MNVNEVQQNAYKIWGKHVSSDYMLYPNENLTRFIFKNRAKFNKILDFGCGDGRHLEMMANAGIKELYGIDMSKECLEIAKNRLNHYESKFTSHQNSSDEKLVQTIGSGYDCVVSWGVMHLNTKNVALNLMKQFSEILNTGGTFFSNWQTQKDSLYKQGEFIENDTFLLNVKGYEGMIYHFPNLDELKKMYEEENFEILSIDTEEFSAQNGKILNSFYIIEAKKR